MQHNHIGYHIVGHLLIQLMLVLFLTCSQAYAVSGDISMVQKMNAVIETELLSNKSPVTNTIVIR